MIELDWTNITIAATGVISAIAGLVVAITAMKKARLVAKALDEAKQRETYIVCPKCGAKVPLSEISFHLPSGAKDMNLNGVPDSEE